MCDADEDVVFEGSVIHQHLQSIGFADYEITQTASSQEQNKILMEERNQRVKWSLLKRKTYEALIQLLWPKEWRKAVYMRISRSVYKAKLPNSDDLLFLRHFVPHTFANPDKPVMESIPLQIILWGIRGFLLSAVLFLVLFLCIGESTRWSVIVLTAAFTGLVWIVTVSYMLYRSVADVEKFVKLLQETAQLISKSLRLLLEEDLISRGFVLAQGSSSFPPCDGKELPHCEGLRQSLHTSLYALLPVLGNSHKQLRVMTDHYSCMRELFDDVEEMDNQLLANSTEHLKFLKKLVTLVKLRMSAVVTELVLCADDVDIFEQILEKQHIYSSHFVTQLQKEADLLSKHLMYAQAFWQKDIKSKFPENSCEEKKKNVYVAIHSLTLHMQAALFRVQELEKRFETLEDDTKNNVQLLPSYEFVKEHLGSIELELQSCHGCLGETAARVDRKYEIQEKEETKPVESLDLIAQEVACVESKKLPIPIFELEEPVIQDEVFEAYIDEEYNDKRMKEEYDDIWNTDAKQERKKLKQQKEQGKRVLHELQPLLNKLRKDWEERENAALQRQCTNDLQASNGTSENNKLMDVLAHKNSERLEIVGKGKVESDIRVNNRKNIESAPSGTIEDSDDERVEVYRRVRKELEMDEEKYTTDDVDSDDVDSDDERLEVYRRVRMELDKDENERNSLLINHDSTKDNKVKFCRSSPTEIIISQNVVSDCELICNELNKKHIKDGILVSSICDMEISVNASTSSLTKPEVGFDNDNKSSSENMEEEVFVHGEDMDDDHSRRIDWSTVTLPIRMTDTLEDRMQLFCGGQNRGFHAEVAAEALAASHQFLANRENKEETFGGFGEGEEEFGDEDSE